MNKKTKWQCDFCYEYFKTKKELIEHLKNEFEEGSQQADTAVNQLEELGVENPYD